MLRVGKRQFWALLRPGSKLLLRSEKMGIIF
ncbi:hypothetical protein DET50_101179 [Marinobacter pelagius]|uniref:Uncharacterized protein n=1 Tax=Marinobacter pelagius TaxID=379482 RepID=A0A366GYL2_9GAMM|nr:hypothetical protein DET50_101179 [Marinobacter pelagius]